MLFRSPKSRLGGEIANPGVTPVPCIEYTVGDPVALCVNVRSAVLSPSVVGVYVTSNTWLPPGSIVTGNTFGVNVYCRFDDVIPNITKAVVSGLLIVVCSTESDPTTTDPKFRLGGDISKTCPKADRLDNSMKESTENNLSIKHTLIF